MTPNNYFEQIEDYCMDRLDDGARVEFESELKLDAELRKEVNLRVGIQKAITELDVISLRNELKNVSSQNKISEPNNESFNLLTDFSGIQEINKELTSEELINFYDSMPKVHVHQHENTLDENIHHFYKDQNGNDLSDEIDDVEEIDFSEFQGLEEAVLEKDIIDLRHNLSLVAKSVDPQFTVEEIDLFLNDELLGKELEEFENEILNNRDLKEEVHLQRELELSIQESEIVSLRRQLSQIIRTETSWNVSEKSIEDFIDGELDGTLLEEFNIELAENSDLKAELKLRRQINEVIGETDVQKLRTALKDAKELAETNKVRKMIPDTQNNLFRLLRTSVAVILVLIGVTGILNSGYLSMDTTYDKFFEAPTWSPERSVTVDLKPLQEAQLAFLDGNYTKVLRLKDMASKTIANSPVFQFYTAASFQKMDNFNDAITEYSDVISHGDNLYIEEAEWFRSLCYLKKGDKKLAKQELLAVIDRNGHYKQDAKAILRRLSFVLK